MAFRFNPRIKLGPVTFGKRGASLRTPIPGLTFNAPYSKTGGSESYVEGHPIHSEEKTATYSMSKAARSLISFCIIYGGIVLSLGHYIDPLYYFIMPFFFLYNALTMLFRQYIYGKKKEYLTKTDRRYRGGYKVTGSREVDDTSNKILYDADSVFNRRLAGGAKLFIIIATIAVSYPIYAEQNRASEAKAIADSIAAKRAAEPKPAAPVHSKHHKKKHKRHHAE